MSPEQVAKSSKVSIERQRRPQMQTSGPICSCSSCDSVLNWRCAMTIEASQRLRSTEEEKTVYWQWFHCLYVLMDLSQSTAELQAHSSKKRHIQLDMRVTFDGAVLREFLADKFCRSSEENALRREDGIVSSIVRCNVTKNRSQSRSTLLTNEERSLLIARENLFHAAFILETVTDREGHQEGEIEQESEVIRAETRPWRDIRVTKNSD